MRPAALAAIVLVPLLVPVSPARGDFTEVPGTGGILGNLPTWGAQAIDIDGDGDVDLASGHHFFSIDLWTNDGSGGFSSVGIPQIATTQEDRHGMLWADLDGDGELDAVCSHGGGGGCACPGDGNELWRGQGGGGLALVTDAGGMLDPTGRGRSFSAADVDGDGDLDLHHAKAPLASVPNSLYRNDGDLAFVDVAVAWGLDEGEGTVGGLFADWDDDGDPDLLVGGEEFGRPTRMWRNDGGVFVDDTAATLGSPPVIAGADWGDVDNDGDLDLAVVEGSEAIYDFWKVEGNDFVFFAHHRLGDGGEDAFQFESLGANPVAIFEWQGTFAPERVWLGPTGEHPAGPAVLLSDAYVGAPTYTPGTDEGTYVWRESAGGPWQIRVSAPPGTVGNYSGFVYTAAGVANPQASDLEAVTVTPKAPRIYRNDGGVFVEIGASLGFTADGNPRHVAWVDVENDGDLDLHVVHKGTPETGNEPDVLWRNDGAAFVPLAGAAGVPGVLDHLGDGGVWADLDGDGDSDLFLQEGAGPAFFATDAPSLLYRNDGPAGHWLALTLTETAAGGTAVGARVTCHAGSLAVHRRVEANSWRGFQPPLALLLGLGIATAADSLVIDWPGGSTQVVHGPIPGDRAIELREGDDPVDAPVVGPPPALAAAWTVSRPAPQPARGDQEILLTLPAPARVRVTVLDVTGRRLATLVDGSRPAGRVPVVWDGRDESGRRVAAGVYFLRGEGDVRFLRRAVRLR